MKKLTGGTQVKSGIYISLLTGEFVSIPREGGWLPGTRGIRYVRVSTAIAAVFGPAIGLVYVIFLPLVGLLTLAWIIGRQSGRVLASLKAKTMELRRGPGV